MNLPEVISRLRYKAAHIKAKLEPEYFSECADYLEKHRWHNLKVVPSDVPTEEVDVLVCYEWFGQSGTRYVEYDISYYQPSRGLWECSTITDGTIFGKTRRTCRKMMDITK